MSKPIAHSFTSITSFETCPYRHYVLKVAKEVVEPQSEALVWGNVVHKAMENRLAHKTPLPEKLKSYESYAKSIEEKPGELRVEEPIALDRNMMPVDWWDKTVWLRCKLDVRVTNGPHAAALDWKTGNRKPDNDQLELFAGVVMTIEPEIERVSTGFIWLQDRKYDGKKFTRSQLPEIWENFLPRIERIERAHAEDKWPKKPSGLCRAWCPVGKSRCEYCGKP